MCNSAIIFVLLCGISYGFVLTSSIDADLMETWIFPLGKMWTYEYSTKTKLNEKEGGKNHVEFVLKSSVVVESVWSRDFSRILKFSVSQPQIFTKSRKNNEYVQQLSNLDKSNNENFYILWKKGVIERVLIRKEEDLPLVNLKKGIASLFQIQFDDQTIKEQDVTGICDVTYSYSSKNNFRKTKTNCENHDLSRVSNTEPILSAKIDSSRITNYEMNQNNEYIKTVLSEEIHRVFLMAKEEIGSEIRTEQTLNLMGDKTCENCVINEKTYEEVKRKLTDDFGVFKEETLITEKDFSRKPDEKTFLNVVNENRENLQGKNLGKLSSAKAIVPLINSARRSNKQEILKVLNLKKNQKILPQLYDVLGFVQTESSHEAVMKKLHFDDEKNEDNNERYLWACQLSSNPNPTIVIDLLNRYKKTENIPAKIQETLILSVASMASKLLTLNKLGGSKVVGIVKETLINNLDVGDKEERIVFLRALRNLKSPQTIPKLLEIISNKEIYGKEEVLAWKALKAIDSKSWNKDVLSTAYKTYFQLDKKHDSSSRTLAADILLESNPDEQTLGDLLSYLLVIDKDFEVKKYVLQQIEMISGEDITFKNRVMEIIRNNKKLNNYSGLAPKGFSLSLRRKFLESTSSNGSLLTVQEMSSGIVKRGIVNIMMDKGGVTQELVSLGIFSGGLGSFLSSDSSESDDVATAGMELAILGSQIRPFVFFEGQGELMGHVWSGTASERTTAFQSLILVQDNEELLRLGSGFIVDVDFKGGASFDLAGKIEMSLWNRNAQALIEKSLGYIGIGTVNIDTYFINLGMKYEISIEPNLSLNADIDFSSNVALCLRLSQPESIFSHNVVKTEKLSSGKSISKKKHRTFSVPGRTYALNRKNDVMCSDMFDT